MFLVWGTRTRAGSQFLIKMTEALAGQFLEPRSTITAGRVETSAPERKELFRKYFERGDGWRYFEEFSIRALQIEDPGIDYFAHSISKKYRDARWLTTLRRLEDTITSHYNIKSWGLSEAHVLRSFLGGIELFEELADQERLFIINVDAPERFDVSKMAAFLGCEVSEKAAQLASGWPRINDLNYQKTKHNEETKEKEVPPDLHTLRERHPWIDQVEERYLRLWERCS